MQKAALILQNPKTGMPESFQFDLDEMKPGMIPASLVGPFLYRFSLTDDHNTTVNFAAHVMMNDNQVYMAFKEFPVIAKYQETQNIVEGKKLKMEEARSSAKTIISILEAKELGMEWIWIAAGNEIGGGAIDKTGAVHSLQFYNYYDQGTICLGNLQMDQDALRAALEIITSITTPHKTYSSDTYWELRDGKMVPTRPKLLKKMPMDFPVPKEIIGKPKAILTPL